MRKGNMANETAKVQTLAYEGDVLTITYPKINKKVVVDTSKLPHQSYACRHGWKQRFGDFESGDKTGAQKFDTVSKYVEHLKAGGDWNMSGERDTTAIVVEALNRIDSKKYPKNKLLKVAEQNPDAVKDWRANVRVRAMIAKIYAERAAKAAESEEEEDLNIDLE